MTAWMDAWAYAALTWLCTTYMMSLHVLVYLAGVALLARAARGSGPAARSGVWAAGALGVVALIPLGYHPDGWWTADIVPRGPGDLMLGFTSLEMAAERARGGAATLRWVVWAQLAWALGATAVLARLAGDWLRARRLTRRGEALRDPRWTPLLDAVRRELGVRRAVRLVASAEISSPLTWGWLRPVILVPRGADAWTDGERRAVLLHETAHIRRLDTPLYALALLGAAWFWFHPAVWAALRAWRGAREEACDRAVLRGGVRASGYATLLLALTRPLADAGLRTAAASAGIARSSRLYRRVDAVLAAAPRPAEGTARLPRSLALAGLIAWTLALGTLRAWPTDAVLSQAARAGGWRAEVAARLRGTDYLLSQTWSGQPSPGAGPGLAAR